MEISVIQYKRACADFVEACGGVSAPQKNMLNLPLYSVLGFAAPNSLRAAISFNRADSASRKGFSHKVNELAYKHNRRLFNKLIKPFDIY